jgi:hypothetical protein
MARLIASHVLLVISKIVMEHALRHVGLGIIPTRSKEYARNVHPLVYSAFQVISAPVVMLHPSILISSEKAVWPLAQIDTLRILPFLANYVQQTVFFAVKHSTIALSVMETITCLVISPINVW